MLFSTSHFSMFTWKLETELFIARVKVNSSSLYTCVFVCRQILGVKGVFDV